jgi:hypothetical protein
MYQNIHQFHIPVMGTGHSIDSPIRVAHLGINSVISVVDDLLLEKIRKYYCNLHDLPYVNIPRSAPDGRALRVTAWLDLVQTLVSHKFELIREMELFRDNEKDRYFRLLPADHALRSLYNELLNAGSASKSVLLEKLLNNSMKPGQIEVNIMSKVDAMRNSLSEQSNSLSDACAALKGFANSKLRSGVVLSAGFNPRLYNYISEFREFYRDSAGALGKTIILKVSDFRSAFIQGKFLAKMGLEVSEFRIESGLNCGGHAFISDGYLMPSILKEFRERRDELAETFFPMIQSFYHSKGWECPLKEASEITPAVTVQGGIGTYGEAERLLREYDINSTGWGSPFLLVPEATCVDAETMQLLADSTENDLYLSNVSPLGVPFNNIVGSGSEVYRKNQIDLGKPGSKCPKQFLVSNTEFTEEPICAASSEYQVLKISQINEMELTSEEKKSKIDQVTEKACLCEHLGNGALIRLGIQKSSYGRQAVCPGPNIAWFNRTYELDEMIDHIYGRIESLIPSERPHMFAKEMTMYVDYIQRMYLLTEDDQKERNKLSKMRANLEESMDYCLEIAASQAYKGENLSSLSEITLIQRNRLQSIFYEKV